MSVLPLFIIKAFYSCSGMLLRGGCLLIFLLMTEMKTAVNKNQSIFRTKSVVGVDALLCLLYTNVMCFMHKQLQELFYL